jgi:hypothetical protein
MYTLALPSNAGPVSNLLKYLASRLPEEGNTASGGQPAARSGNVFGVDEVQHAEDLARKLTLAAGVGGGAGTMGQQPPPMHQAQPPWQQQQQQRQGAMQQQTPGGPVNHLQQLPPHAQVPWEGQQPPQQQYNPQGLVQGMATLGHLSGRQHPPARTVAPPQSFAPGYPPPHSTNASSLPTAAGAGQVLNLTNSRLAELPPAVCEALACGAVSKLDISGNQVGGC